MFIENSVIIYMDISAQAYLSLELFRLFEWIFVINKYNKHFCIEKYTIHIEEVISKNGVSLHRLI